MSTTGTTEKGKDLPARCQRFIQQERLLCDRRLHLETHRTTSPVKSTIYHTHLNLTVYSGNYEAQQYLDILLQYNHKAPLWSSSFPPCLAAPSTTSSVFPVTSTGARKHNNDTNTGLILAADWQEANLAPAQLWPLWSQQTFSREKTNKRDVTFRKTGFITAPLSVDI